MDPSEAFAKEVADNIERMGADPELRPLSLEWLSKVSPYNYGYNFRWMGRPIIQLPQDILAMQEIIWEVKPDLIIETGIAHGGSIILYASLLELNAACGGPKDAKALGIDIDIRAHNRTAIEAHPMFSRIEMIQGSSVAKETIDEAKAFVERGGYKRILVALDSNHTHEHVLAELNAYAPFTAKGSYCIVFDTIVEDSPQFSTKSPWGKGNNPKTAVWEFLKSNPDFQIDKAYDSKLQISCAPNGYLKRIG